MSKQSDFKRTLDRAVDLAVAWREDGAKLPAISPATADELRQAFDIEFPDEGLGGAATIERLGQSAERGLGTNTHPNFYAWVQGSSDATGVAADLLTSAWGQNAAIYQTSPAAAIAEEVAAKWLLDLLGLPANSSVAFSTGATMASFICLSAARSEVLKRVGYDLEELGFNGAPNVSVLLGEEAHATIHSDLRYLGFGNKNLVKVAVDGQGRMRAADLDRKMAQTDGPKIVICQAGHINSGAFDPFIQICEIARQHDAWVHADGAFGLWARAVPELTHLAEGLDEADSWTVDGHKWLQIPYDSGFAMVKHPQAHRRAMDISASYLVANPDDGRNPSHYGPELSRRARGFAVWAVLLSMGRTGVVEMISRHCLCARHLQNRLEGVSGIQVVNDVVLNQVAIVFGAGAQTVTDRLTTEVVARIRAENINFVLGANWKGREILRISIISQHTDIHDIDVLADSILNAWQDVQQQLPKLN